MNEKEKKKQIIKISVFITSLFVILLSVTYAFINMTLVGTRRQVITAGNLELELLEDENNLQIENVLPMYDEVGMLQEAFTFRLVNKTSQDTNYILKLIDITTGERLDLSVVKYEFTKDKKSTIKFLSVLEDGVLDKGKISGNQTLNYSLRLWIDSSVEDETLISGKSLSYRIGIEVTQDIEISYVGMIKARGLVFNTALHEYLPARDRFYQYSSYITNVVFENKIDIPSDIDDDKKWDISEKTDGSVMAYIEETGVLESGKTSYKLHIQGNGKVYANPDSSYLFSEFSNLLSIEGFENFDTLYVENMSNMFSACGSNLLLDLSPLNTSNVEDMSGMFSFYSSSHPLDLSPLNTSNVEDMSGMFSFYSSSQPLDLTPLDTSNVKSMSSMLSYYSSNHPLDLSPLDTSNVENMLGMFSDYNYSESLDLSPLDTSKVTNMSFMFSGYSSNQSLDLSPLNTSKVTNMSWMFSDYSSSQSLDLSPLDTSKVTNMSYMFSDYNGPNFTFDFSTLDTSNVTDMSYMFRNFQSDNNEFSYNLSIKGLETSNVKSMKGIFSYPSTNLSASKRRYYVRFDTFDTRNVTNFSDIFDGIIEHASLNISNYDLSNIENIDSLLSALNNSTVDIHLQVKNEEIKNWILAKYSNFREIRTNQ